MSSAIESSVTVATGGPRKGRPRRQYRDLVTRHEKTLHAEAHLQRLQQGQEPENLADEVNVACSSLTAPRALGTPPDDELEAESHNRNDAHLGIGEPPSPGNEIACSLSPSSSSSSSSTAPHDHRASFTECARTSTHDPAFSMTMAAPHVQAPVATGDPTSHQSKAQVSAPDPHPYDHAALDAHAGEQCLTEMMDTDTAMAFDNLPTSEVPHQDPLQPSAPMDHDPTQFFFSPMPSFDLDQSVFAFLPLPDESAAQNSNNQSSSNQVGGLGLQQLPIEGSAIYSIADNPLSQSLTHFGAQRQPTDEQDTPRSYSSSNGLPSLQVKRQTYAPASLDAFAYESIRNDLSTRLTISASNAEIPSAKVCQGFLSSYITSFHGHLPIIHLKSFSPRETPSPLILAMCSIGALYRLDRRRAKRLYEVATSSLEIVPHPPQDNDVMVVKDYCLWYAQTKLLLSFYAIMSGDKDLISGTMHNNGFYTLNKGRSERI
ncbi:hypothetical protein NW762_012023 [Fusarium torreyae]|uniref:Xylanolytic transcriptional activator regulatory domain-containing protein n=1 Tax=Fusarium torreyae TaxID=1237075 RepID=A0A9W8RRF4_9HYPO|nr:hypothetical protein NW762_012023 [Fusarium torreyae]